MVLGGLSSGPGCSVRTNAVIAEQGRGAVVVWLILLLPNSELVTGDSLMLRGPLQTQTGLCY